ncbi:MAG: hypothetical protein WCA32_17050 [Chromatiaceae bacterium]
MKGTLPVFSLSLSFLLGGCCMQVKPNEVDRFELSEFRPGPWCGIFSGYGTTAEPERAHALYSPVSPFEFGEILCENRRLEDYASCVNRVVDYYRASREDPAAQGSSNSGPFAAVIDGKLYFGSYRSDPFSGYFRISNDATSCSGSYNAFLGSKDAVFAVRCDDGRTGSAEIVRDREGRSGIGYISMADGTRGKIVFGQPATSPPGAAQIP